MRKRRAIVGAVGIALIALIFVGPPALRAFRQAQAIDAVAEYGGFLFFAADPNRPVKEPTLRQRFFGRVVEVNLVSVVIDDRVERCPGNTPTIVRSLRPLRGLRRLTLSQRQAVDENATQIAELRSLEELSIRDAELLSDAGAAAIFKLPALRRLHIIDARVGDDAVAILEPTLPIETVVLQGCDLTDEGVAHLARIQSLRHLGIGLGRGAITDAEVKSLRFLSRLEFLDLQGTAVTDEGVAALQSIVTLRDLWLGDTAVTEGAKATLVEAIPELKVW